MTSIAEGTTLSSQASGLPPTVLMLQETAVPSALSQLEPLTQISTILAAAISKEGWEFHINGQDLSPEQVVGAECVLPLLMWEVEKMYQTAFSQGTGVEYISDGSAMFGARPSPDCWTKSRPNLVLFSMDVLVTAFNGNDGALDHLATNFVADYEQGLLPWSEKSASRSLNMAWMSKGL